MLPATDGYWSTMPIPSVCITATSWGRGGVWLNTGAWLIEAARFVEIIDERQGLRIASPPGRPPRRAPMKNPVTANICGAIYDTETKGG